jgi:hypothetical protein
VEHGEGSRDIMQIFWLEMLVEWDGFFIVWIWANKSVFGPKK